MREAIGRRKLEDEYSRYLREMRGEAFVEMRNGRPPRRRRTPGRRDSRHAPANGG